MHLKITEVWVNARAFWINILDFHVTPWVAEATVIDTDHFTKAAQVRGETYHLLRL